VVRVRVRARVRVRVRVSPNLPLGQHGILERLAAAAERVARVEHLDEDVRCLQDLVWVRVRVRVRAWVRVRVNPFGLG
jgi:hypothetical protein